MNPFVNEGTRLLNGYDLTLALLAFVSGVASALMAWQLWEPGERNRTIVMTVWLLTSLAVHGVGIGASVIAWWHMGIMVATGPYAVVSLLRAQLALSILAIILWAVRRR